MSTNAAGIEIRRGKAVIEAAKPTDGASQCLLIGASDPHAALLLAGKRLASDHRSYAEVWVRPQATETQAGDEFIDFDGAAIALFRSNVEGKAEFAAFHQTDAGTGYWLTTGQVFDLDARGASAQWHRLNVMHNWEAGTWELEIDGAKVLIGLHRSGEINVERFQCWLFGQPRGECRFDDLLISPLPPDELETQAIAKQWARRSPTKAGVVMTPTKASAKQTTKRRHSTMPSHVERVTTPSTYEFHVMVVGGGRHITEIEVKDPKTGPGRIALYSPGYDDKGQPIPLKVEIRSDDHLSEGLILADLQWAITEVVDAKSKEPIPVLVHGDFSTGPTQLATVPSKWSNKGITIHVAPHLIDQEQDK
jgi:hypothetical protein